MTLTSPIRLAPLALAAVLALAACKTDAAPGPSDAPPPAPTGKACGGIGGLTCGPDQYCRMGGPVFPDKSGTCEPRPQMCNMLYQPVCGTDGKTYPNACHANRAGTNVAAPGQCLAAK